MERKFTLPRAFDLAPRGQRGFAYVGSLGVVIVLTILGATLLLRGVSELSTSERYVNYAEAFYLAEAAGDQAIHNLQIGDTANIATTNLSGGSYWAEVNELESLTYRVIAHGATAGEQRNVEVIVGLTQESIFKFPVFGDDWLDVSGSAFTDSFDSRNGSYDSQTPGDNGNVGTNSILPGGVNISGSIGINGQVVVGPTSNPESVVTITGDGGAGITGDPPIVAQQNTLVMDPVVVPDDLTCSDFTVSGNSTVSLEEAVGTYCFQNLTVQGGGTLTADGSVTVYLTGELYATGNTVIGVVDDPTQMMILMSSTGGATLEGTITGNSTVYGPIYAPEVRFTISGSAEVFGSIIAEEVDVSGSADIHYDEALETLDFGSTFSTTVLSWREL